MVNGHPEDCPQCMGEGVDYVTGETCPRCGGTGREQEDGHESQTGV